MCNFFCSAFCPMSLAPYWRAPAPPSSPKTPLKTLPFRINFVLFRASASFFPLWRKKKKETQAWKNAAGKNVGLRLVRKALGGEGVGPARGVGHCPGHTLNPRQILNQSPSHERTQSPPQAYWLPGENRPVDQHQHPFARRENHMNFLFEKLQLCGLLITS